MKILLVNQHPLDVIGGSEIQCDLIAAELARRGHDVLYFAVYGRQTAYAAPYRVEAGALTWRNLARTLAHFQPDLVYWRHNKRQLLRSVLLFKLKRVKVVFAISHQNDVGKWAHKVRRGGERWRETLTWLRTSWRPALASRVNHFGYYLVDGVVAQLRQQTGQLPIKREIVIANSVDASAEPFAWKRPFVIWAASIKQSKNPERFIELARSLQDAPVDFLMAGEIVHRRYHELIAQAASLPNFHYLGAKTYRELNGMIRQARLLVHTCEPEGFPNILIQAWMQGKPTVSLYYDPDQMIAQHRLGCCSGTFAQFQTDVRRLLTDDELCATMGQRARQFAEARFSPEYNVRELEAFFRKICEQKL